MNSFTRSAESAISAGRLVKSGTAATQAAHCGAGETPIGVAAGSAAINTLCTIIPVSGDPARVTCTDSIEFLSASGWTSTNWTGSWATGWAHTAGNTSALSSSAAPVAGRKYKIAWTVSSHTDGTFTIAFGGNSIPSQAVSGSATVVASTTDGLSVTPTSAFDGTLVLSITGARIEFGDSLGVAAGGLAQVWSTGLRIGKAISQADSGTSVDVAFASDLISGSGASITISATVPTADPGTASGTTTFVLHYTSAFHGLYFWNGASWEQLV